MSKPKKAVRKPPDIAEREKLEEVIFQYVKQRGGSVLRGRFFDVGTVEGKREYAEWLAGEILALNKFAMEVDE